jgi:hypothetical protein
MAIVPWNHIITMKISSNAWMRGYATIYMPPCGNRKI